MTGSEFQDAEKDSHSYDEYSHNTAPPPDPSKIIHDLEIVETLPQSDGYPHGTRLVIVVISLMLSTFIVALDNVSIMLYNSTPGLQLILPQSASQKQSTAFNFRSISLEFWPSSFEIC